MNNKKPADLLLIIVTAALVVIGVFLVYDSSYARASQGQFSHWDPTYFLKRQLFFAVFGVIMLVIGMKIPYWKLRKLAPYLLAFAIICLVMVMVPHFGVSVNGARRWLKLGPLLLQPSEFAKLFLIIFLAAYLSNRKQEVRDWKRGLLPLAVPVAITALLVVKEDMGTAIIIAVTSLVMVYMAGAKSQHIMAVVGIFLVVGIVFIAMEPYRVSRLMVFMDPFKDARGSGYQVCHGLIAMGSGGPLGVGLCEGREKLFYLPAEHTDFIFAVLGEEAGLVGTSILAFLFLAFAFRGFQVAFATKDLFGKLIAGGISVMIGGQALLNMCVVTSSVPATGVPLPFISYGGSSLALNLLCVGVLLGVSQYPMKPAESGGNEDSVDRRGNRRTRLSGPEYR